MSYSGASILALIIHLMINYDVLGEGRGSSPIPARRAYRAFSLSVIAYYITDILWGFLYERQMMRLVYADTALYFIAMAFTILLWTQFAIAYLDRDNRFARLLDIAGKLIFAFQIVVVLLNFFTPILFSFDENNVYHPLIARYITLAAQIAMFLMTAAYAFGVALKSKGTKRFRHRTVGIFSMTMTVFDLLQTLYSLLPMYAIGCILGGCLLHSFVLENEKEEYRGDLEERLRESIEKDMLTGLPAMTSFFRLAETEKNAVLKRGGEPALLYMDFSGMKFYNGKYGFEEGDKLLKEFAGLLVRYYGNDRSSRLGATILP